MCVRRGVVGRLLGAEVDGEHVGGVHTVFVSVHPMVGDDGLLAAGPYIVVAAFIWRVRSKRRGVDGVRLDLREVDDGDSCGGEWHRPSTHRAGPV